MAGEKNLENRLRDRINAVGGCEFKIHGSEFQTGIPDLFVCYKGRFIALEVKNPNGNEKRAALQIARIKRIRASGGIAEFIQNEALLEEILACIDRGDIWHAKALPNSKTLLKMDRPLRRGESPLQ